MTWLRVDDGMVDHPKIEALSDAAYRALFVSLSCGTNVPFESTPHPRRSGWRSLIIDGRSWATYPSSAHREYLRRLKCKRALTRKRRRRQAIIDRDGMVCGICRAAILDVADLHIDHKIPLARGGTSAPENLQPAHALCNIKKGAS